MKPTHHSHVPPLGQKIYQPTETRYNVCTDLIFLVLSARKPADALHIQYVHELPSMVPQLVLVMRHFSRDVGGQAVQVRDVHRAGAHNQQHHRVPASVRDPLQLLHRRLHRRHGNCTVCYEDLAAEERMLCLM